ncbi:MAG: hypothetical protein KAQ89_04725 [Planctomycetes bacterium]|nr:hypothetical protein [Planctomycetota bacterium]
MQHNKNKISNKKNKQQTAGSAFILAVVMTSLLAIIGVMFLMAARVEKISTSSISENKELNLAVDSIIAIISRELTADLPGEPDEEYYDYPDSNNAWLASIEPYYIGDNGTPNNVKDDYHWQQISDITNYIYDEWGQNARRDVEVQPEGLSTDDVVREYPEIKVNSNGKFLDENGNLATDGISADADGDGIADSKWIQLNDITTNKGKPIYAAIRIIDNGAMLNINTSYEFDPNDETNSERIDGSSQTQINLAAVARGNDDINDISSARGIPNPTDGELLDYQDDFIWRVGSDNNDYTPFDISDELELRYRFCINSRTFNRIEDVWDETIGLNSGRNVDEPYDTHNDTLDRGLDNWQYRITDPCDSNDESDFRHLLTYYNMDRIIDPDGYIMLNINIDANDLDNDSDNYNEPNSYNKAIDLYDQFTKCIDPNLDSYAQNRMREKFAQLAVNIVDLRDHESDVTSVKMETLEPDPNNYGGNMEYFYGLEPHPVITKIGIWIDPYDPSKDPNDPNDPANPKDANDPNYDPNENTNYYAVELFNPFDVNIPMDDFVLLVTDYNENMDANEPNNNSTVIAEIQLLSLPDMDPNDYYVIHSPNNVNDILFNNAEDIPFSIKAGTWTLSEPNLILSIDYAVTYDLNGPNIIHTDPNISIDPNIVDSRNLAIKRRVKADSNTISNDIYVDRQLIYKDWVRWDQNDWDNRADPNLGVRYYKRNFDMEDNSWWYVVYPDMIRDSNDSPLGEKHFGTSSPNPMPEIDIAMPWDSNSGYLGDLVTVGDISRIWTIGPHDYLFDPLDMNEPNDANGIYDPNTITPFEPNDPNNPYDVNEPNDANGIYANYNSYSRTVGETLKFVSRGKNYSREDLEELIRIDLADPDYHNLFQYITVFDPASDNINNDGDGDTDECPLPNEHPLPSDELKIPGRININTAPWYVIAQLPWMREDIAKAIVAYRDKLEEPIDYYNDSDPNIGRWRATGVYRIREAAGFESIGELATVINKSSSNDDYSMHWYALNTTHPNDIDGFPDLTPGYNEEDGAKNDFEERDIIFSRISNLVTVRSDVYTAYILVRIGTNGPQKRYIAIFDRSDAYTSDGFINVIALQQVPDPR